MDVPKIKAAVSVWHIFKPPHDKTNKMACAPSKDSAQSGHPPSLIRVFTGHMKKALVLSYPLRETAKILIRLGGCPGWSESSLGAHACHFVGFVVRRHICNWFYICFPQGRPGETGAQGPPGPRGEQGLEVTFKHLFHQFTLLLLKISQFVATDTKHQPF